MFSSDKVSSKSLNSPVSIGEVNPFSDDVATTSTTTPRPVQMLGLTQTLEEHELNPVETNDPNYCLDCGRVAYYSNPDENHEDHFCECLQTHDPVETNDPNYCLDCGRVAYYSNPDKDHEDHFCECLQTHDTTPCKLLEEPAMCRWD
jgi:hypothetical protein